MSSKRKTVTNILLTLAFVFLPPCVTAQTNTFPSSGNAGVGTTAPWQKLTVLGTAGNREGVSIAGEGNTWVYTDLNLTPVSSGIATGKPTNFAWSVRKDAYYGGDSSGPSLVMEVSRQGGGVYVPFIINPSGNLLLASATNATNGNVGIGTLAPAYKLQVGSTIWGNLGANYKLAIDGDLALGSYVPGSNSGLSIFEGTNGYRFNLFKRAGYTEFYDAEGKVYFNANVGVGTTAPNYKLDVQGGYTSSSSGYISKNNPWATSDSAFFPNGITTAGAVNWIYGTTTYINNAPSNGFGHQFQGANAYLAIGGGSLGVGTVTPNYRLDVQGGQINSSGGLCIAGDCKTAWSQVTGATQWTTSGSNIYYNSGNVGIGTTDPSLGGAVASRFTVTQADASTGFSLGNTAGTPRFALNGNSNGTWTMWDYGSGAWTAGITQRSGSVGIGTNSPVQGKLVISDTAQNASRLTFAGQEFYAPSMSSADGVAFLLGVNRPGNKQLWIADSSALTQNSTNVAFRAMVINGAVQVDAIGTDGITSKLLNVGNSAGVSMSGNVGIGMNPTGYKLDVNGEINATGFRINGTPISAGGSSQWTGSSSIYYNGGNVGVGTTSPAVKFAVGGAGTNVYNTDLWTENNIHVQGNETLIQGGRGRLRVGTAWGYMGLYADVTSLGNSNDLILGSGTGVVRVGPNASAGAPAQSLIVPNGNVGIGNFSPTEKLHVTGNGKFTGNLTVDGNINAKYQDLAEWVPSSERLSAGTVVVLDPTQSNQVISSTVSYDTRVAGVISAQPGITLGESGEGKVLVATTGRVRVKVDASRGPIQIGDLLVTSDVAGVAMKSVPVEFAGRKMHMPGTIIGKALEPLAKGSGEILVLLSLQ